MNDLSETLVFILSDNKADILGRLQPHMNFFVGIYSKDNENDRPICIYLSYSNFVTVKVYTNLITRLSRPFPLHPVCYRQFEHARTRSADVFPTLSSGKM